MLLLLLAATLTLALPRPVPVIETAALLPRAAKNPKRGISFAENSTFGASSGDIVAATQSGSTLTWVYDWGTTQPSYLKNRGLEYIPMQWGLGGADQFQAAVLNSGAKVALGFNEPDLGSQSNILPADAAAAWKKYIDPLHDHGVRLGAPAVTNGGPPLGAAWLQQFFGNCTGCHVDFIPFHWYGDGIGNFYDYIWSFYYQFNAAYPLWVTEFASTNSDPAVVADFASQTSTYMDSLDWIERYAWFALARTDPNGTPAYLLLDNKGQLNSVGKKYILAQ